LLYTQHGIKFISRPSCNLATYTMPPRKKQKKISTDESDAMYAQMARQAGESLKSFSRTKRYLADVEVDMCANKILAPARGFFKFASTSVQEFLMTLADLEHGDTTSFLAISGVDNQLIQHVVVILNLWDPLLPEDDLSQELHFVVALFNPVEKKGLLVDPMERREDDPECDWRVTNLLKDTLINKFAAFGFDNYSIESRCLAVQTDLYNCGPWCLSIIDQYVESNGDLSCITAEQMIVRDIKKERTRFSKMLYGR
jgi:hypothetical protein